MAQAAGGPSHAVPAEEVLARQQVDPARGLTEAEAASRRAAAGANRIEQRRRHSLLRLLAHQFVSPVIWLLAGAAALAWIFGERLEALAIAAVLALNATIGFVTEGKAARSIEALRALDTRLARVRRDGQDRLVPAETLVPGDILRLDAGDAVPADLRLIDCSHLQADESALTGESAPVTKSPAPVPAATSLADRAPMLFRGTSITRGSALAVVVATGPATELGQIGRLVSEADAGLSPIERKLTQLSTQLLWAMLALAAAIAALGFASGEDPLLMVEAAIALAVAAVPEGLPIVATLTLARGMWRMARQNALIQHLPAVQTLGATTVILTDKTGTLTENRMTVRRLWLPSGEVAIEAATTGEAGQEGDARALLRVAVLCNDAAIGGDGAGVGDPMERALLRAGQEAGLDRNGLLAAMPLLRKHAFDSFTRMMATVHAADDACLVAVKGAPEAVLAASRFIAAEGAARALTAEDRAAWAAHVAGLAHRGLRVLAFASKTAASSEVAPYADLIFLGLAGLEDPARADVPAAILACQRAGIRVVMATGDHAATARSIGRAVGLSATAAVAEGLDLAALAEGDGGSLTGTDIFARVSPQEKFELVRALQARGEVVAMTGDGVNDAPALRQADIGVAMGLRGTDVAREAAAMILLDDAFPTIVAAIREGRVIFGNIRRFAAYLLACNLAEVLVVGIAVLAAQPLPILPLQILYLNLVTDVFPAFALALGEGDGAALDRPPRNPREPILGRPQWRRILWQAALMAGATFAQLAACRLWLGLDAATTVTMTFLTLAFAQLWQVFGMRSEGAGIWRNEITRNPWVWGALGLCTALLAVPPYVGPLADLFGLTPPDARAWALILGLSLAPLAVEEAARRMRPRRPVAREGRGASDP
ncbi:cation-translocating P-type ATPase [Frigidibacter oleivorans]|uniref:cation-translocating P-type ATPase n=1 Tax=Frigidibacter oleivorans TaxID=2487129 RepID=UPI000F8CF39B|nr:cation-transporting P-type ATPase [Frigidibacter oleivorans]